MTVFVLYYVLQCILILIIILLQLDLCCWSMLAGRVMMAASFSSVRTVRCPGSQSTTLTRFQTRSHCHTPGMLLSGELIKSVEFIQLPIDCTADNQGGAGALEWSPWQIAIIGQVCTSESPHTGIFNMVYCLSLHGPMYGTSSGNWWESAQYGWEGTNGAGNESTEQHEQNWKATPMW